MEEPEAIEMSDPNGSPQVTGSDEIDGSVKNTRATSKWYQLIQAWHDNDKARREIHIKFFWELKNMGVLKKRPISMIERTSLWPSEGDNTSQETVRKDKLKDILKNLLPDQNSGVSRYTLQRQLSDIVNRADKNRDNEISLPEFLEIMKDIEKNLKIDVERLKKEVADAEHSKNIPWFMILISLLQLILCIYHSIEFGAQGGWDHRCSRLILIPQRRWQNPWTFMSYVFTHADWSHYLSNLVLQLVLGIPLETVHGFFRVSTIYLLSGAGAGLYRSSFHAGGSYSAVPLTGASGCAFALLGAEVADWVINWRSCHHSFCDAKDKLCFAPTMREAPCCNTSKWLRFVVVICFALVTIVIEPGKKISVVTHIAGLAYGFFIGLLVLKDKDQKGWLFPILQECPAFYEKIQKIFEKMDAIKIKHQKRCKVGWIWNLERTFFRKGVLKRCMRLLVFIALICFTTRFLYLNMELLSEFLNEKKTQCDKIAWSNDTIEIERGCARFNVSEEDCSGETFSRACHEANMFNCLMDDYREICEALRLAQSCSSFKENDLWVRNHTHNANCSVFYFNC